MQGCSRLLAPIESAVLGAVLIMLLDSFGMRVQGIEDYPAEQLTLEQSQPQLGHDPILPAASAVLLVTRPSSVRL